MSHSHQVGCGNHHTTTEYLGLRGKLFLVRYEHAVRTCRRTLDVVAGLLRSVCPNLSYLSFLFCSCVFRTGYVGKWKRHWFVLNDAVLYYFITPQHQDEAPRCIIPLEGINISPVGATDLSIGLRVRDRLTCCFGVRSGAALSRFRLLPMWL